MAMAVSAWWRGKYNFMPFDQVNLFIDQDISVCSIFLGHK
jgi:hypothetical protein